MINLLPDFDSNCFCIALVFTFLESRQQPPLAAAAYSGGYPPNVRADPLARVTWPVHCTSDEVQPSNRIKLGLDL